MVQGIITPPEEASNSHCNPHLLPELGEVTGIEKKLNEMNYETYVETLKEDPQKPSLILEVPRSLDASRLRYTKTTTPMSVPDLDSPTIETASQCTDHMITAIWNAKSGWADPELKPYGNFSIPPTMSCLHYGTQCFEGLKMYRGYDGAIRLFRPNANCERLLVSSHRVSLPSFDPQELQKLIVALVAVDGPKWLPKSRPGSCVYLRPCIMGSEVGLGVAPPKEAILFVIATFMPPAVFADGLRLLADEKVVRAWPGGFGFAKVGANYGPGLRATYEAKKKGFHQVLWLFENFITEAGASNFFVIWKAPKTGKLQLVTAPLDENKLILDGITRRCILQLVRERLSSLSCWKNDDEDADTQLVFEPLEIVERNFTINELIQAVNEGRVVEAFASGTAYFVCPVYLINYKEQDYKIPVTRGESGSYSELLKTWLTNIMYGNEAHEWAVIVKEETDDMLKSSSFIDPSISP